MPTKPTYSQLIDEEKANPQRVFNKTFKCPHCGHCYYEGWKKITEGEYTDDREIVDGPAPIPDTHPNRSVGNKNSVPRY